MPSEEEPQKYRQKMEKQPKNKDVANYRQAPSLFTPVIDHCDGLFRIVVAVVDKVIRDGVAVIGIELLE